MEPVVSSISQKLIEPLVCLPVVHTDLEPSLIGSTSGFSLSPLVLPLLPEEPKTWFNFPYQPAADFTRNLRDDDDARHDTATERLERLHTPTANNPHDAHRDTQRCHGTTTPNTPTNNRATLTPTPHLHAAHPRRRRGARVPNKSVGTSRQRRPPTARHAQEDLPCARLRHPLLRAWP